MCTSGKFARKKVHGMCTNDDDVSVSDGKSVIPTTVRN